MSYLNLIFDIDDTLLDFQDTEERALDKLFVQNQIPQDPSFFAQYKEINTNLWQQHEAGIISREAVLNQRFALFFKELGKEVDGSELEKSYRAYLNEGHKKIVGAEELLQNLAKRFKLYAGTNGSSETQQRRLKESNLLPYFDALFISEELGVQKPEKTFFEKMFAQIPNFKKENTLMIGDSLSSDMAGGLQAGIATCWFNPQKLTTDHLQPTYTIYALEELYPILA